MKHRKRSGLGSETVKSLMTCKLFDAIKAHIHVVDNTAFDEAARAADHLWKVRPPLTMLEEQSMSVYTPARELALDDL